uniref:Uncharacterized protein n=1 Tax=Avena sativa TaxID=4498 RepID=A0ACD5WPV4_AVESA
MEPPQVWEWEPCKYQPADWSMEHAVWIPSVPVLLCEYESTEMACVEETFAACSRRGQQLVQYAAAAATPKYADPFGVFKRKAQELGDDHKQWGHKMHKYPPSIRKVGKRYTVPTIVSIGPYHHGRGRLKKAEEAKHVAAYSCIQNSSYSVQEMYDVVVNVAEKVRSLYDKGTMEGIDDKNDFYPMMFYDACFLVQFMLRNTSDRGKIHAWLSNFFKSNKDDIYHDILLLENQLPWVVLETLAGLTSFEHLNLKRFAKSLRRVLQNSRFKERDDEAKSADDRDYSSSAPPPHLLGYVRLFIVGTTKESEMMRQKAPDNKAPKVRSFSVSAIELAEMGITLTPSKTPELAQMGFKEGRLSGELFLPHLLLNYVRASFLVNMAALEVTSNAQSKLGEDTAFCSYVQLLGMMMDKEKDVQELRSKRLLQGGGGLTDKETLDFFTSLQAVTRGPLYHHTIRDVEMYKQRRRMWVHVYVFCYKYKKTMLAVLSAIATLAGILGTLNRNR